MDMDFNIDQEDVENVYFKQIKKWKIVYYNVKFVLFIREYFEV